MSRKNAHLKKNFFIKFLNISHQQKFFFTNQKLIDAFSTIFQYNFFFYCQQKVKSSNKYIIIFTISCEGISSYHLKEKLGVKKRKIQIFLFLALQQFHFLEKDQIDIGLRKSPHSLCQEISKMELSVFYDVANTSSLKKDALHSLNEITNFSNNLNLRQHSPNQLTESPLLCQKKKDTDVSGCDSDFNHQTQPMLNLNPLLELEKDPNPNFEKINQEIQNLKKEFDGFKMEHHANHLNNEIISKLESRLNSVFHQIDGLNEKFLEFKKTFDSLHFQNSEHVPTLLISEKTNSQLINVAK